MIPRVDLTEPTAPAPGTLRLSMPVYSTGTEASEKVNPRLNIIIYVLKPVFVYSSLLKIQFKSETGQYIGFAPPGDRFEVRACPNLARDAR